jgi:hypothetical protein
VANLGDIASLIVASFDLAVVRGIRGAIKIADLTGATTASGAAGIDRYEPGSVFHPTDRYERRRVIHPEPRYDVRPHLDAAHSQRPALEPVSPEILPDAVSPCAVKSAGKPDALIEPPWRSVPWENPMPPRAVVKVVKVLPDVIRTGKLIDFYT